MKALLQELLARFNMAIARKSSLQRLQDLEADYHSLLRLPKEKLSRLVSLLSESKSQIRQDLFVLSELDFKQGGYFVEFGATNGVDLSNTYLLEKAFGWNGIVAEPAKCWHEALASNRSCKIEHVCVWKESNASLLFNETELAEYSTIGGFAKTDFHHAMRKHNKQYSVDTISLLDLLDKYDSPREIDYLSIDTEGSEFDILSRFDFSKYRFRVITCEHNFTPMRDNIFKLLSGHGYERKYTGFSQWDDWYVSTQHM